ncbi:MAG: choice-of-anchor Q domain-containing protein, partial [Dokdonella sp.]
MARKPPCRSFARISRKRRAFVDRVAAIFHSTISGNVAPSASGLGITGAGGIRAFDGASITQSTISGNSADGNVGGVDLYALNGATNTIMESTISGNSATSTSGLGTSGNTSIMNSTIAFNVETGSNNLGAVHIYSDHAGIHSTIIANNTSAHGQAQNIGPDVSASLGGVHNLIGPSPSETLPVGTIGGDPQLFALRYNGGPTKTHALRLGSPAVDAGSN